MQRNTDIVVIGAGCSGCAAALGAAENGAKKILVIERAPRTGGVLRQCIHNGFGIHHFQEDLTGVEFARKMSDRIQAADIPVLTETAVLSIEKAPSGEDKAGPEMAASPHFGEKPADINETRPLRITAMNRSGLLVIRAKAVILSCGCRERPRGALMIPGTRPAGIFTAGSAQYYMNVEGYLVGRNIVILGSGDIGLIMARQFVLEGANVAAIAEVMPYSSGLPRNLVQCAEDFGIPVLYRTTVTRIDGSERVTGVELSEVDGHRNPIPGTQRYIPCDTLILSVGLIPENELASSAGILIDPETGGTVVNDRLETSMSGVFACGNALHVHDLADFVVEESLRAGKHAAEKVLSMRREGTGISASPVLSVKSGRGVRGIVPQKLSPDAEVVKFMFRPSGIFRDQQIRVLQGDRILHSARRKTLVPGEMCSFSFTPSQLDPSQDIVVEVCQ